MAVIISIALQKGGTGKTTTALALAGTLGSAERRVLLIDADSQCNTTDTTIGRYTGDNLFTLLAGQSDVHDSIVHGKYYDLLPSDERLININATTGVDPTILRDALADINQEYQYIIIDTPPALGNLLYMSLVASDYIIIPLEPLPYCIQGIRALYQSIIAVRRINPRLSVLGILLIKYNRRTVLSQELTQMIRDMAEQMHTIVFDSTIRTSVTVSEAQQLRIPLVDYKHGKTNPNADYQALTTEILSIIEGDDENGKSKEQYVL